jgi:hypothetical protein
MDFLRWEKLRQGWSKLNQYWLKWPLWAIVSTFALCILLDLHAIEVSFRGRTWHVPSNQAPFTAHGTFLPSKYGIKSPYQFKQHDGSIISFSCLPNVSFVTCLDEGANKLRDLAGKDATVGYFVAQNYRRPILSNILLSLDVAGMSVMDIKKERSALEAYAAQEDDDFTPKFFAISFVVVSSLFFLSGIVIKLRK